MSDKKNKANQVYGRTRYGPQRNEKRRYDATQKVKESVKNASEKKNEFLKKLQEIEKIAVKKPKGERQEVDGTVHFAEDEFFRRGEDALHQDLEICCLFPDPGIIE